MGAEYRLDIEGEISTEVIISSIKAEELTSKLTLYFYTKGIFIYQ